jgi:hypothetical protein
MARAALPKAIAKGHCQRPLPPHEDEHIAAEWAIGQM